MEEELLTSNIGAPLVQKERLKGKDRDPPVQRKEYIKDQTQQKDRKNTEEMIKIKSHLNYVMHFLIFCSYFVEKMFLS